MNKKRIRDLLRLSRNVATNTYEAQIAKKKAESLMRRYNLTERDLYEVPEETPQFQTQNINDLITLLKIKAEIEQIGAKERKKHKTNRWRGGGGNKVFLGNPLSLIILILFAWALLLFLEVK